MSADLTDHDVTEAMLACGGSFVRKLGELFRLADYKNQVLIKETWAHEWIVYAEFAALLKQRREEAQK